MQPAKAIYVRLTSSAPGSLDAQLGRCRARAGSEARVFIDDKLLPRRLSALVAEVMARRVNEVFVLDLSRFGTNLSAIAAVLREFELRQVKTTLCGEGLVLDPTAPDYEAVMRGFALAGAVQNGLHRERSARGRETMARRGAKVGPKPKERPDALLRELGAQGLSLAAIARQVGVSKTTVYRWLKTMGLRTRFERRSKFDRSGN